MPTAKKKVVAKKKRPVRLIRPKYPLLKRFLSEVQYSSAVKEGWFVCYGQLTQFRYRVHVGPQKWNFNVTRQEDNTQFCANIDEFVWDGSSGRPYRRKAEELHVTQKFMIEGDEIGFLEKANISYTLPLSVLGFIGDPQEFFSGLHFARQIDEQRRQRR